MTNLIFHALLRSGPLLLTDPPVFLLAICPVLIVVGAVLPPLKGRRWLLAALLVLGMGTVGLFLATPSGGIPDPHAHGSHATGAVLWIYESLTMEVKIAFAGLTVIFIAVFVMPDILHRRDCRLFSTVLPATFLILYSAGAVFLIQTADSAACVVHRLGVHPITMEGDSQIAHQATGRQK
ncbi:MAG: hypothetical protein WA476_06980 [Acidobacteriaceae bacterium]